MKGVVISNVPTGYLSSHLLWKYTVWLFYNLVIELPFVNVNAMLHQHPLKLSNMKIKRRGP